MLISSLVSSITDNIVYGMWNLLATIIIRERYIMIRQTSSRMLIGHIISLISSLASSITDTVYIIQCHGMWNLLAFMSIDSYYYY